MTNTFRISLTNSLKYFINNLLKDKQKNKKMSIEETEKRIIEEFELFDDWMDKYNYIIELGKSLPLIDPQYKDEQHLIPGCQSQVWLHAEFADGKLIFRADSDAIITKGIINLLIRVLSNRTPQEIADAPLAYIDQIGLK